MNRKTIKKIMLFLLALMLVFPVYSFGKAEAVQAAALKAPKLSKVTQVNKSVKVTWKKSKGATGYYVCRKVGNGSWKKIKTVKGASTTSYVDKKVKSGTTYYYTVKAYKGKKVSSYNKKGLKIVYKAPTATPTPTPTVTPTPDSSDNTTATGSTIENTASEYSIEADITLSGTGSGYHAKLVACTATSAVSFGIQYDKHARAPYTGKAWFMIENVAHNGAGGQNYIWVQEAARNKTYHVMLAVKKDGTCNCYVNGKLAKSVKNPSLAKTTVYLRVEGSARLNGDSVNATFSNIKLKADGKYNADKVWGTHDFTTNKGIKSDASAYAASKKVTIKGKVSGLASGQDWDSAYEQVSGIIQFVN